MFSICAHGPTDVAFPKILIYVYVCIHIYYIYKAQSESFTVCNEATTASQGYLVRIMPAATSLDTCRQILRSINVWTYRKSLTLLHWFAGTKSSLSESPGDLPQLWIALNRLHGTLTCPSLVLLYTHAHTTYTFTCTVLYIYIDIHIHVRRHRHIQRRVK